MKEQCDWKEDVSLGITLAKAELQHFKETTLNHAILMGRVTFDGMGRRLLPNGKP